MDILQIFTGPLFLDYTLKYSIEIWKSVPSLGNRYNTVISNHTALWLTKRRLDNSRTFQLILPSFIQLVIVNVLIVDIVSVL